MAIDPYELAEYMQTTDEWRQLGIEALGHVKESQDAFEADWDMAANMVALGQMGRISPLHMDEIITIMAFTVALLKRQDAVPKLIAPPIPDAFNKAFEEGDLSV